MAAVSNVQANNSQNPRAACQQQVTEYGIAAEQAQDYIRDCIASMGGSEDSGQGNWGASFAIGSQQQPSAVGTDSDGSSGERELPQ